MSSFFDEIAAKLAQLSGVATPEVSRDELNEFNVRDIQAVRVSEGGGGGGGNVPFVGVDPPDSPTDGMLWWDPDDDTAAGDPAFAIVRFAFAFDTPGIVGATGVPIYTPTAGDYLPLYASYISITTPWDGSGPSLNVGAQGEADGSNAIIVQSLTSANSFYDSGQHWIGVGGSGQPGNGGYMAADSTPLVIGIDDGSGGDPGSMQGEAEIVLVILKAGS